MAMQSINDQPVDVVVIGVDGRSDPNTVLEANEIEIVEAADAALCANEEFQVSYRDARLDRVESMRSVDEHRHGRYYLRYRHAGGVTEFWAHIGHSIKIDFTKGSVSIKR